MEVLAAMRVVVDADRAGRTAGWHELQEQQHLLLTYITGVPAVTLEKCHALAELADPRYEDLLNARLKSSQELRQAIASARARLDEARAKATTQLAVMTADVQ